MGKNKSVLGRCSELTCKKKAVMGVSERFPTLSMIYMCEAHAKAWQEILEERQREQDAEDEKNKVA